MKVILNIDGYHKDNNPTVIALGTFDGVHIGHRELVNQLQFQKLTSGAKTMVYTFIALPKKILSPGMAPSQLMHISEKISSFRELNIDILVLNAFSPKFYQQTPSEFIEQLTQKYQIQSLVVGYNFRFGHNGAGDISFLKSVAQKKGFQLIVIPPVEIDGQPISSTLIRSLVIEGRVSEASKYLTKPYSIEGKIVHGHGRGKLLGYPTANLAIPRQKVLPKSGVYLTQSKFNNIMRWSVTNVGRNPTFGHNNINIETYLLQFNGFLYDHNLKIFFMDRIRDEIKFDNIHELKAQISEDVRSAKKIIYKFL